MFFVHPVRILYVYRYTFNDRRVIRRSYIGVRVLLFFNNAPKTIEYRN